MAKNELPLKEVSIEQLFSKSDKATYEIPIYQRNYAWESDEIYALVQDVYDAYTKQASSVYYIGTLVTYYKGDEVYEVIDGQQRLTTIMLVLCALGIDCSKKLSYRARKRSDDTIRMYTEDGFDAEEVDEGIVSGFKYAQEAVAEKQAIGNFEGFKRYFCSNVHIIHYNVHKDIDLNHYF